MQAGFGLWLDYNRQPRYFSAEEWQRTVSDALAVSDGYVWIYSEGLRFFPPAGIVTSYIAAMADMRRRMGR